jgi:hypothetical protein
MWYYDMPQEAQAKPPIVLIWRKVNYSYSLNNDAWDQQQNFNSKACEWMEFQFSFDGLTITEVTKHIKKFHNSML